MKPLPVMHLPFCPDTQTLYACRNAQSTIQTPPLQPNVLVRERRICRKKRRVFETLLCCLAYKILRLKRCTKSPPNLRFYEETMCCRLDSVPEPISPGATHHCSPLWHSHASISRRGSRPPTFLVHREALSTRPQMTSRARRSGHLAPLPVESAPPLLSKDAYWGEAPCPLAPCTHGFNVTSPSVGALSAFALAICSF